MPTTDSRFAVPSICRRTNRSSWSAIMRATSTRCACWPACRSVECTARSPRRPPTISSRAVPRAVFSVIVINGLPFDRASKGGDSLDVCRELLAQPGRILILFPEGTRSESGVLGRFRTGIARLVAGTQTPVVPCHLSGAYEAWPKGALLPRPRSLRLRIGRPRRFADVAPGDRDGALSICTQLRNDVMALAPERADQPRGARRSDRCARRGAREATPPALRPRTARARRRSASPGRAAEDRRSAR